MKIVLILWFVLSATGASHAQSGGPWSMAAFTIDGGGQCSSGGTWTLTGTVGQADASAASSRGGDFAVAGGFWPGVVTAPGGPVLAIAPGSVTGVPGTVRVEWPAAAAGHQLQYTENLEDWTPHGGLITGASHLYFGLNNGSRYFFRLKKP